VCRREVYASLGLKKHIVAMIETDKQKGGATADEMMCECRQYCVDQSPAGYLEYGGPDEVIEKVFAQDPIVWARIGDFQAALPPARS